MVCDIKFMPAFLKYNFKKVVYQRPAWLLGLKENATPNATPNYQNTILER